MVPQKYTKKMEPPQKYTKIPEVHEKTPEPPKSTINSLFFGDVEGGASSWLDQFFLPKPSPPPSVSRNVDVPWVRAPILRHSVGTCHCRFAMARWARLRFALLWVYWFSLFLCVLPNVGLLVVGLSWKWFPRRLGKH